MKSANILRKIFLTIAAVAVVASYLGAIYFIFIDDFKLNLAEAPEFAKFAIIPVAIFIVGLVLGEAKESWAHKLGIGLHLVAAIIMTAALSYWGYLKFIAKITSDVDRLTVPAFVTCGGLFFYYFSYIFQAVESSKKAKLAEQHCECGCGCGCECGCEQPAEQYYDCEQQPEQGYYYEQPVQEEAPIEESAPVEEAPVPEEKPVEQPAPAAQPAPQPAPQPAYPYPPFPPYGCYPAPMCGVPVVQPVVQQQVVEPKKEEVKVESHMPEDDVHVAAIMKWKKLYLEGIVTEREFIRKRDEILGLRK